MLWTLHLQSHGSLSPSLSGYEALRESLEDVEAQAPAVVGLGWTNMTSLLLLLSRAFVGACSTGNKGFWRKPFV